MPGGNRPRAAPADPHADRRARATRAPRREIRRRASRRSAARCVRAARRDRAGTSASLSTRHGKRSRAPFVAVPRAARPLNSITSSARWMRCASSGRMRAAATRIERAPVVHAARASHVLLLRRQAARAIRASLAASRESPCCSARKYRPVPPTSNGTLPVRAICCHAPAAHRCGIPRPNKAAAGSRMSISRCGWRASVARVGFGGADIQAAIDQRRIHADELQRKPLRQRAGQRGLARRGRAHQEDGGRALVDGHRRL